MTSRPLRRTGAGATRTRRTSSRSTWTRQTRHPIDIGQIGSRPSGAAFYLVFKSLFHSWHSGTKTN